MQPQSKEHTLRVNAVLPQGGESLIVSVAGTPAILRESHVGGQLQSLLNLVLGQ